MINDEIIDTVTTEMLNGFNDVSDFFSETRDIFSARLHSFILREKKYLESAIIGEIGNNTFDHNYVYENNRPRGVYCNLSYNNNFIVLADYGRGIKQSLASVLSSISSDIDALEIAFTKHISGRSPEQRGNGLKFVSETIKNQDWHFFFQSGIASCLIDRNGIIFKEKAVPLTGCLAIIDFNKGN
ncbi:MAG: hypothetical protein FWB86_13935 [Treponema sp.]|nr:hypothetical protein [Treponema sp.]